MELRFPIWCFQCKSFIRPQIQSRSPFLCSNCFDCLPRFESNLCLKCGRTHDPLSCRIEWSKHIRHFHALFLYDDPVRSWISSLKYSRNFVAGRMLQRFVADWFKDSLENYSKIDLVLPIPVHFTRLNQRGFNQAVFLLNKANHRQINTTKLIKNVRTVQQAGKTRKERKENLKRVFSVRGNLKGKNILLFDDVCTTGQTLAEAAATLKRSGADQIDALVLCRSIKLI